MMHKTIAHVLQLQQDPASFSSQQIYEDQLLTESYYTSGRLKPIGLIAFWGWVRAINEIGELVDELVSFSFEDYGVTYILADTQKIENIPRLVRISPFGR